MCFDPKVQHYKGFKSDGGHTHTLKQTTYIWRVHLVRLARAYKEWLPKIATLS